MYDEMGNVNNVLEVQEFVPENLDSLSGFEPPPSPPSRYATLAIDVWRPCRLSTAGCPHETQMAEWVGHFSACHSSLALKYALVLSVMNNRSLGPCSAAIDRILISGDALHGVSTVTVVQPQRRKTTPRSRRRRRRSCS
jgi:hypothetical protein